MPKKEIEQITCEQRPRFSLISEDNLIQKDFSHFIQHTSKKLQFVDMVVLWSLIQMNMRPDQSSPSAKLQILIKTSDKEKYFNSYSQDKNAMPYLNLLNQILKEYRSKYSLLQLARLLDQDYQGKFLVSKDFEHFLTQNKINILQSKLLKKYFARGDETLKNHERIPKVSFRSLVKKYLKSRKLVSYDLKRLLFSYPLSKQEAIKCNFDMGLYKNSLFLINKAQIKSNIFGMKSASNSFMAVSSQEITSFTQFGKTLFFQGKSHVRSASVCSYNSTAQESFKDLWLISSGSRDPGQHLYHLLQYGITQVKDDRELSSMLSFSRHQFLKDPVRLIIESRRSNEKQINELLRLNIPIYNAKSIGRVWGKFNHSKNSSFFLDERRQGHLLCK